MILNVEVKNLSSLTIGGTSGLESADIPMTKLIFPGSTLKGVMRTSLHLAIKEWEEELKEELRKENKEMLTSCGEIDPAFIGVAHANDKKGTCDVCSLFGFPSPNAQGRGKVSVHLEVSDRLEKVERYTLTRVKINDSTQTSEKGSLFTQEVYRPGTVFKFRIELNSNDEKDLLMVLLSLYYLRLYRVGRGGMVDLRLLNNENELCTSCGELTKKLIKALKSWMTEGDGL
ncbi:MAG: RAMP superfamily CRISPR-associated protein [Metallosphaera sp.]|uniref:RAMP superfamily CRISPR-associated protein n=1 Tax=Metallosphaera sp. TaxID=2020860 RepID=UPI003166BA7A